MNDEASNIQDKSSPLINEESSQDYIVSESNAKFIYKEFIELNKYSNKIISIEGAFGSGKSTTKKILLETLQKDHFNSIIAVDYISLQYEEPSQITSQLYMEIGNKLSGCNKHSFRACAVLKKQNIEASYITGSFGVIALIIFLITLSIHMINNNIHRYFGNISNSIYFFSTLIIICLLTICIYGKDWLVKLFSGVLPRYTHVDILKNDIDGSEFKNKTLIILVDEIDRLDGKTIKILLDEILILHELLDTKNITHKFFMFYNYEQIKTILSGDGFVNTDSYLQKYRHARHQIMKPDFSHAIHWKLFNCKQNHDTMSVDRQAPNNAHIFSIDNPQDPSPMPSSKILLYIAENLRSFRDLDRFESYISSKTNSIYIMLSRLRYDNSSEVSSKRYILDMLIITIFFDFYYNTKLTDILESKKSISDEIKNVWQGFIPLLKQIYSPLPEDIMWSESTHVLLDTMVKKIADNYYSKQKIYPSTLTDSKVEFTIDKDNNLENIFSKVNEEGEKEIIEKTIRYITNNLGEFISSAQSTDFIYLRTLKNGKNPYTINSLITFFTELDDALSKKLYDELIFWTYTTSYAVELYQATINCMTYCLCKLISQDEEQSISTLTKIIDAIPNNSFYPILYLALKKVTADSYPCFSTTANASDKYTIILENLKSKTLPCISDRNKYKFLFMCGYILDSNSSIPKINATQNDLKSYVSVHSFLIGISIYKTLHEVKDMKNLSGVVNSFNNAAKNTNSPILEEMRTLISNPPKSQCRKTRNEFYMDTLAILKLTSANPSTSISVTVERVF